MPFFSIIIPTYNSEKTLKQCLESVVNQSFTNFEALIMDGVSTDKTLEIAENSNDYRIRIFSEKDKGIYDAMNKGIKLAKGEWLYFLGSDDELYNLDVLCKIYEYIEKSNIDIIYGNVYSTLFGGIYDGVFTREKIENKNICHQAMFFNKKVFKKTGKFDLKYKAYADWDHNLKCFFSSRIKNMYVNEVIANYADGGYSSIFGDNEFAKIKSWKIIVLKKEELFFITKLKRIYQEFRRRRKVFDTFQAIQFLFLESYKLIF